MNISFIFITFESNKNIFACYLLSVDKYTWSIIYTTVLIFIRLFLLQFFHIIKTTSVKNIQQVSVFHNAILTLRKTRFLWNWVVEVVKVQIDSGCKLVFERMVLFHFFVLKIDIVNIFRLRIAKQHFCNSVLFLQQIKSTF